MEWESDSPCCCHTYPGQGCRAPERGSSWELEFRDCGSIPGWGLQRDRLRGCEGGDYGQKCLWRKPRQPWKQGDTVESCIGGGAINIASLHPQASMGSWTIEKWSEVKWLSRVWFCNPLDCSAPGSSIHGILQARILEWVAISFSKGSFDPGIKPVSFALAGRFFTTMTPGKPHSLPYMDVKADMYFLLIHKISLCKEIWFLSSPVLPEGRAPCASPHSLPNPVAVSSQGLFTLRNCSPFRVLWRSLLLW